jgi:hypothetical protein|tara:strand:+ start:370 stop:480 length:111 start_codon:yes stop_codon:yes gene_type:complete
MNKSNKIKKLKSGGRKKSAKCRNGIAIKGKTKGIVT